MIHRKCSSAVFFQWTWFCCWYFRFNIFFSVRTIVCVSVWLFLLHSLPIHVLVFLRSSQKLLGSPTPSRRVLFCRLFLSFPYNVISRCSDTAEQPNAHTAESRSEEKHKKLFSTDLCDRRKIKPHWYFACRNDNTLLRISPHSDEISKGKVKLWKIVFILIREKNFFREK